MPLSPLPQATTAADLAAALAWRCEGTKQTANGWMVRCPAHEDSTPSLSITPAPDKVLLRCMAGCPTEQVLSALDMTWAHLFLQPKGTLRKLGTIVALYDYVDPHGTLLHQTVRFLSDSGKKEFRQRRPDPAKKDGWVWRIKDVPHVLYHLPDVLSAVQAGETVYLVEGEKDADNLQALGLTATTNAMGADSWEVAYNETLRGAHLVMLPDHDPQGLGHMLSVAHRLHGLCASIKILPDLHTTKAKSDVSDWLAAGGTREALEAAVAAQEAWSPGPFTAAPPVHTNGTHATTPPPPASPAPAEAIPTHFDSDRLYTDTYNARALVAAHGPDMHYVQAWKAWLIWTGTHWHRDTGGVVMRWAKQTIKNLAKLLPSLDDKQAFALLAHIKSSLSTAKLRAAIDNAQSEEGMMVEPDAFDRDIWLLNCANGTIDLRTGQIRSASRADLLTKCLGVVYDPHATCPRWEAFLTRAMGGKQGLVAFLHRAIGYSLTGSTIEQCLFILHGPTKTGKTTFLARLRALLGPYGTQADMESFMHKDKSEVRNDLADLVGRRVVCAVESQEGRRLNENLIKQLTGGLDQIKARFLFEEYFTYTPQYKIFLGSNHKPVIKDTDQAIWERIRLVPFIVQIPLKERDKKLDEALQHELPGILAWAVRGCLDWQHRGDLEPPPEVLAATEAYQQEMDVIGRFITERCTVSLNARVYAKALYDAYKAWCDDSGERWETQTTFGKKMTERGYEKKTSHTIVYQGLELKNEEPVPF